MIAAFTYLVATGFAVHATTLSRPKPHSNDELPISLSTPRQQIIADGGAFSIREASPSPSVPQPEQRMTFKLGAHVALPLLNYSVASNREAAHEAR